MNWHISLCLVASFLTPISEASRNETSLTSIPVEGVSHIFLEKFSSSHEVHSRKNLGLRSLLRSSKELDKDSLLVNALKFIANTELSQCNLVVAFDWTFKESAVLGEMIKLPQFKQILEVRTSEDFSNVIWESFQCRGYIFLFHDPYPLLAFADEADDPWDYGGKYIIVGLTKNELDDFTTTNKGEKTQHIIGLIQESSDEWKVYMNQLYWGKGMIVVNRWRNHGFTSRAEIFPDKTWDLRGAALILYTFQFEPHVMFNKDEKDSRPYGRDIQMADTFAEVLNFTLIIKKSPDGEFWGFPDANGSWNGMNGKMQRKEGHFGLGYSFLTNNDNRLAAVDFSQFYDVDRSCFLARTEPPLPKWQSLAAPFKLSTWLAFLIGLFVFCPVIYIYAKVPVHEYDELKDLSKFSYSFLYTWGIHLREPQLQLPKRASTQVWVVFLWIYAIILTTVYGSNLTAFLTVERPRASIETIEELHASGRYVIGIGCYFYVSFKQSSNPYAKDFIHTYLRWTDEIDFPDLILSGKGVFIETRTFQEYVIVTNYTYRGIPSARIMKECYQPQNIGVTLQRHFPVKENFNKIIGWLISHGIMKKWYMDILRNSRKNSSEDEEEERLNQNKMEGVIPLSIDHLQGIFYIQFLASGIGIILFVFEILCFKRKEA